VARLIFIHPFKHLKRFMPRSLFGRVSLILLTPLVFVMTITTFVFIDRHWEDSTQRLSQDIAGNLAALVEIRKSSNWPPERISQFAKKHFDFRIHFNKSKARQHPFLTPMRSIGAGFLMEALHQSLIDPFQVIINKNTIDVEVVLTDEVIHVSMSRKRLLSKTAPVFLMWQLGTPILFFIIAAIFMHNQIRPIRRLAYAANRFGKGREVRKFKPEGAFEVRQAGIAFNLMRERIERQITQRTEMLAGVSHDLRTPLTRMGLQLAMLKETAELKGLKTDVKEMTKMIEAYLGFARGEDGEKAQPTTLKLLLDDVIASCLKKSSLIHLACDPALRIELRVHSMKRCITNLLENALRYAHQVWIHVEQSSQWVTLFIEDDGPGIAKEKREDVFKPFFRLEQSRNIDTGGVGLGLAIAKDLVHQHGGKISLRDSPKGGLRVVVKLPI
jgi:two-component system osmolarity sensor histidine kinase EnvZ